MFSGGHGRCSDGSNQESSEILESVESKVSCRGSKCIFDWIHKIQSLITIVNRVEDNRLWRLRYEISKQLNDFTELFEAKTVLEAVAPVYMKLLEDPMEIIREQTLGWSDWLKFSAEATYRVLNQSIEADIKKGVYYLFKIISFVKSTKYQTREVWMVIECHVDILIMYSSICSIINC